MIKRRCCQLFSLLEAQNILTDYVSIIWVWFNGIKDKKIINFPGISRHNIGRIRETTVPEPVFRPGQEGTEQRE
jgi:hypothetical protein